MLFSYGFSVRAYKRRKPVTQPFSLFRSLLNLQRDRNREVKWEYSPSCAGVQAMSGAPSSSRETLRPQLHPRLICRGSLSSLLSPLTHPVAFSPLSLSSPLLRLFSRSKQYKNLMSQGYSFDFLFCLRLSL